MKSLYYNLTLKKIWAKISLWGGYICTRVWIFVHGYVQMCLGYVHLHPRYVHLYPHKDIYKIIYKNKRKPISYDIGKRKQTFLLSRSNFKRLILQDLESLQARIFNGMGAYRCARTHEGRTGKRMKMILRRFMRLSRKRMNTLSENK